MSTTTDPYKATIPSYLDLHPVTVTAARGGVEVRIGQFSPGMSRRSQPTPAQALRLAIGLLEVAQNPATASQVRIDGVQTPSGTAPYLIEPVPLSSINFRIGEAKGKGNSRGAFFYRDEVEPRALAIAVLQALASVLDAS